MLLKRGWWAIRESSVRNLNTRLDEATEPEMDEVRGGEAVDGGGDEWVGEAMTASEQWRITGHVDSSAQHTHEMFTRSAKADPRSEIRRCGSRDSFPRSTRTPSLHFSARVSITNSFTIAGQFCIVASELTTDLMYSARSLICPS